MLGDLPKEDLDRLNDEIESLANTFIDIVGIEFNDNMTRNQVIKQLKKEVEQTIKAKFGGIAISLNKLKLDDD